MAEPIAFPSRLPGRAKVTPRDVVAVSTNPYDLHQRVQRWPGQRWEVELDFPSMNRDAVQILRGFRLAMRGPYGTCSWSPVAEGAVLGANTGTPVVDGAGQAGDVLYTRGWTHPPGEILLSDASVLLSDTSILLSSVIPVLKAGDWIGLGTGSAARLHQLTTDAWIHDGPTGAARLDLWPAVTLAQAPADGQAIVTTAPRGVFRLEAVDDGWEMSPGVRYGMSLKLLSVI